MQNLLLFLSVAVLAALASLPTTNAAVECYNCVTFKTSWGEGNLVISVYLEWADSAVLK